MPAKILKLSSDIIAPSLTQIFNLSLETGIYVDDRKRARVIPIYKAEDKRKIRKLSTYFDIASCKQSFRKGGVQSGVSLPQ